MTFTVSSLNDIAADQAWAFGADEAVPSSAFDLTFDDEGCLYSYWVIVNERTGSKALVHTDKGEAALNAFMKNTSFIETGAAGDNWDYTAIK